MVCVPCIAVPLLLIIWRFIVQPLLMKWWQFRGKLDDSKGKGEQGPPQLIKDCKNGVCTLSWKNKTEEDEKDNDAKKVD